jgi:hypothetical protein
MDASIELAVAANIPLSGEMVYPSPLVPSFRIHSWLVKVYLIGCRQPSSWPF